MPETVRFAPSPTGELHIGNIRTALYNWFIARRSGGRFLLRYDDTDVERSEERYVAQIAADLAFLGIVPDQVERQSARLARYDAVADLLRDKGLFYPCYETPEELERKRARQRARGLPPVYDRAALALGPAERAALEAEGRRPHWRFRLPGGARHWEDRCRGAQTVNLAAVSDPILVREDGSYLYTLTSVVDDIDMAVTTIVRGEDHVTNSGVQIAIFEALEAAVPAFAHHNLLTRSDGEPLSKRDNPLSIRRLAEDGYEPMAVASLAALVGTSHPAAAAPDLETLARTVALGDISRGPAMFDPTELTRLNAALVHELDAAEAAPALPEGFDAALFWQTVRGNLTFRKDAAVWAARLVASPEALLARDDAPAIAPDDHAVLVTAAEVLADLPFDGETYRNWTKAVRERTGAKGKALFLPLRKALTGAEAGPELAPWLMLLGKERALARLASAAQASTS
ncbi:MAG: glutamate--tRNA ligase [Acuticoccus sp.]